MWAGGGGRVWVGLSHRRTGPGGCAGHTSTGRWAPGGRRSVVRVVLVSVLVWVGRVCLKQEQGQTELGGSKTDLLRLGPVCLPESDQSA